MTDSDRIGVVGAGIIGLATAWTLMRRHPGVHITVFEKESDIATHQTGRNSGVVHAGIYYRPGSLKARLCTSGRAMLKDFCSERGLFYDECGKLLIALDADEEIRLRALYENSITNGVPDVRMVDAREIRAIEPHARGRLGLHSPRTAIVDFRAVARALAAEVVQKGGVVETGTKVTDIDQQAPRICVGTSRGSYSFTRVVNCAGLYADTVAGLSGDDPDPQVIPFRGAYMALRADRADLVRGLIYPVPDPRYPFLGVHLSKSFDGSVLVGPSAVLAFAREGYSLAGFDRRELLMTLRWSGFRRMAKDHWRTGAGEMWRAVSRRAFVAEARRYVPELRVKDVVPARAGVRAQAVSESGEMVDDFRISTCGRVINVRNAPSPAATSSLAIAELIADQVAAV